MNQWIKYFLMYVKNDFVVCIAAAPALLILCCSFKQSCQFGFSTFPCSVAARKKKKKHPHVEDRPGLQILQANQHFKALNSTILEGNCKLCIFYRCTSIKYANHFFFNGSSLSKFPLNRIMSYHVFHNIWRWQYSNGIFGIFLSDHSWRAAPLLH